VKTGFVVKVKMENKVRGEFWRIKKWKNTVWYKKDLFHYRFTNESYLEIWSH